MAERAIIRARALAGLAVLFVFAIPTVASTAQAASTVQTIPHATIGFATNQSNNWSGYNIGNQYPGVATGTLFKSVSGEWTVPIATQHTAGEAEYSASWVGIGGGCVTDTCTVSDNTLIQAGTEQDVSNSGRASYSAWWEIIPEPQTSVSLPVAPGNQISVTISQTLPGLWSIVIRNLTTGASFSTTTPYSSSMDTAEWIEETPLQIGTSGTGISALPNLGSVQFYGGTLNGANPGYKTVDEMQLANSSGTVIATPSAPGPTANDFNDCTFSSSCTAP
jgi:hypothetical protein